MKLSSLITNTIDLFYIPVVRRFVPQQIFRYGACGALNMSLDAVWYFVIYNFIVAKQFVDLGFVVISPHILSLAIVFPITFFTGFWLNRNVAFRTTHIDSWRQMLSSHRYRRNHYQLYLDEIPRRARPLLGYTVKTLDDGNQYCL